MRQKLNLHLIKVKRRERKLQLVLLPNEILHTSYTYVKFYICFNRVRKKINGLLLIRVTIKSKRVLIGKRGRK